MFKKDWTPVEADEWTKEDGFTILISPIIYVLLTVGTALSLLLQWQGYVILAGGVILTIIMHSVIDPKLKAISEEYERRQQDYLEALEEANRWE